MADKPQPDWDPVFLHSRREAKVIFSVWLAALLWSVPYCYYYGYVQDATNLPTVLGVPAWLFWGIGAPWIVADLLTIWLCFGFIKDDDLRGPDELKAEQSSQDGDS